MASCRVFQGCRALLAAAKGASAVPSTATKASKGSSGGGGGALTKARPAKGASVVPSTATKASKGSGGGGGALKKARPAKGASAVPSTAMKASKGSSGGGGGALGRARPISTALGEFLGVSEASTLDVVMKFADHIRQHNLLNPQNKREILCDDKLKMILNGEDSIRMVDALNLLSQHFLKSS